MIILQLILSQLFSTIPLYVWMCHHSHNGTLWGKHADIEQNDPYGDLTRYEPAELNRTKEWEYIKYKKQN